ncbi:MAG: TonB-dependent receptor [Spongiibacteraceae bacterium]
MQKNEEQINAAKKPTEDAATEKSTTANSKNSTTTKLGSVVVRGKSQLARLNDVPQAASVITAEELNRELSVDLNSITRRSAGIRFNQNNTRGASLSIRGLGKRSFTETQDPSVGLTVDGVSYALTQLGNFDFYDIESVQVLRGPRGTEGGKDASAGAVNIVTKRPSFTPASDFQLVYGQRDAVVAKANFTGPIIDDLLAWRGSIIADRGRGFYESEYDPNYSFYNRNRFGGRAQFLLTPTPELTARFSVDLEPKAPQVENGLTFRHDQPERYADGTLTDASGTTARAKLAGFGSTGPRSLLINRSYSATGTPHDTYTYDDYIQERLLQNENQGQTVTNKGASAEVNYALDAGTFTSITAWRKYSFDAHNDEGTPLDIQKNGGGGVDYSQYSQEFRFDGSIGGVIDYSTGIYALQTKDTISSKTGWGSDAGAWFATTNQYNILERNAGTNRGAGIALLEDSLNDAYTIQDTNVDTRSTALFGKLTWHANTQFDIDAGLRATYEDRSTKDTKILASDGTGFALNPVSVRGVALGGFNSTGTTGVYNGSLATIGAGTSANIGFLNSTDPTQIALANAVALKYFGVANYNNLTPDQARQIANAKALRAGQIGTLSNGVKSTYHDLLYTAILSPSYKINENITTYFSYQRGEKSGSALNINFVSSNVDPENTNAYELGIKTILLDNTLTFNTNIYYMDIRDYQTAVRVVDEFTTATNIGNGQANPVAYVTAQGNVDHAKVQGWEFDLFYSGIPYTTLRVAGAYTDAYYVKFENAAFPEEDAYLSTAEKPYTDQNGENLPGVSKWTGNIGAEFRYPVFNNKTFHASFNTSFNSRYNNITDTNTSNSDYGWVAGGSRTDASIGITTKNNFDLSIIARNLFDDRKHEEGWTSYTPYAYPKWLGISFSGKL